MHKIFSHKVKQTNNIKLQLLRSILIGAIASIIDIIIFAILVEVQDFSYLLANLISFSIGLVVNYSLTIRWVFISRSPKNRLTEFLKFTSVGIIGLIMNQFILWLCIDIFMIYSLISKIIATLIAFLWNFFARKYYIF